MIQTRKVFIAPKTDGPPWWDFNVASGTLNNGVITIDVGLRHLGSRSEKTTWSEGSIHYFAETIAYEVVPMPTLTADLVPYWPKLKSFSLRLVLAYDPAQGHWQLLSDPARGTKFDAMLDASAVRQGLAQAGQNLVSILPDLIQNACKLSFDQIQAQLAADGILEKGASENTLISKRSKLRYYKGDTFPLAEGVGLGRLKAYCAGLKANNASWHLPNANELGSIFSTRNYFTGTTTADSNNIIDTPDHRLWGSISNPSPPGIILPTDSSEFVYQMAVAGAQFVPQVHRDRLQLWSDYARYNRAPPDYGRDPDSTYLTDGWGNTFTLQAICVAPLYPRATEEGAAGRQGQQQAAGTSHYPPTPRPACTTVPKGPSKLALPGTGKNVDQFRADDADCRQYALSQTQTTACGTQRQYDNSYFQCMYGKGNQVPVPAN